MEKLLQMKKWKFMLSVVLAGMLLAAWTAHADSEIKVIIDGEEVKFEKSPVVEGGTTLVPFRVLFEKLGLSVVWVQETKTITGQSEDILLHLQLDNKTAVINGEEVELTAAPRVIDGSTYVPLRLVGEATGRVVKWDNATRTITIDAAPSAQESFDFEGFYRSFIEANNAEDLEAVLSAIHPESPLLEGGAFEAQLAENFRKYDIVTELDLFEVEDADESEAMLYTIERNINTNDRFHMDNQLELFLDLMKDENGEWKIYDLMVLDVQYLVSEDELKAEADIDQGLEKAVLGAVEAAYKAIAEEDIKALMDTIDPESPAYNEMKQSYSFLFMVLDFELNLEHANVIEATDTDAFVYTTETMKRVAGLEIADTRSKTVHQLKKQADGSWKLYLSYTVEDELLD
jgi:Copper amine oxidase N-terminal domain.